LQEKFPPNIYYKIFTHRNVADIGAFAPRDYTLADNKSLPANLVHNKGTKIKPGTLNSTNKFVIFRKYYQHLHYLFLPTLGARGPLAPLLQR
jgi:hypothetical protein